MFGKKSKQSSLESFVMRKGMEVGNLKRPMKATMQSKSPMGLPKVKTRKMSPGKAGPVKITGGG